MADAYLDLDGFKARTVMPDVDVDGVEDVAPGWILQQLRSKSALINARLEKRYATPFKDPPPEVVCDWLTRLVTPLVYMKRGVNPADAQFAMVGEDAKTAIAELTEAADSEGGKFDLPLRADTTVRGVVNGGPYGYSEASPYDWTDAQQQAVRGG